MLAAAVLAVTLLLPPSAASRARRKRERRTKLPGGQAPVPEFSRPEMGSADLAGTVKAHEFHLMVNAGPPSYWDGKVSTPLIDALSEAAGKGVKVTACHSSEETAPTAGADGVSRCDVLVFPIMRHVRDVQPEEAPGIVAALRAGEHVPRSTPLPGKFIFVCCHGARDDRCGACGPQLVQMFNAIVEDRGLVGKVHVYSCSHVGGHAMAGNVIAFGRTVQIAREGGAAVQRTAGDWYGYVVPGKCDDIVEALMSNRVLPELWRGETRVSPDEHKKHRDLAAAAGGRCEGCTCMN